MVLSLNIFRGERLAFLAVLMYSLISFPPQENPELVLVRGSREELTCKVHTSVVLEQKNYHFYTI